MRDRGTVRHAPNWQDGGSARAAGVQVGTPFAVTEEGDAHANFKRVLAGYLKKQAMLRARAKKRRQCTLTWDCLMQWGLRDGLPQAGQFCIDHHLAAALRGDVERGLFFRGSEPVPFGAEIRPVRELVDYLLN
jgi:nitronate monooxygenase